MKEFNFSHHGVEFTTHENTCYHCKETNIITVDAPALANWKSGMFVQDAFPDLTVDERELIMTGIHPTCWAEMFPEEEN